ncbi:MAG: type II toxin-antitoxin system HicA family toxin [Bryobacteraceae bacterium]
MSTGGGQALAFSRPRRSGRRRPDRTYSAFRTCWGAPRLKRHELIGHLEKQGCRLEREGGRHTIYSNPASGAKAPVPRHAGIDNRLAAKICQQLSVTPIR